jgi:flagellar basal-body rod modification protein FlgD
MQIGGINTSAAQQAGSGQAVHKSGSDLDINDFFKLISTQMQNQSMYDTVDNAQFMSQMVQFSTLSQISEMTKAFQSGYAVSLIGKQVSYAAAGEDGMQQVNYGTVEQVSFNSGIPYVFVNGEFHKTSEIMDVGPQAPGTVPQTTGAVPEE